MASTKATAEHKRKARRAALALSACVVAFAIAFIGLVNLLDYLGPREEPEEVIISDVPEDSRMETFYVLLIGSDTRKGTALYTGKATDHAQTDQHSDVMTLMRVNPETRRISLLTIPRDTVIDGQTLKINNALLDNNPLDVVDAVEELTGLRADYYMMTTFADFSKLIDALGGIDVDVPADISVDDPATGSRITLKAGKNQHLKGSQALALARARHEYGENQDVVRQSNVRAIEKAIVERVLSYHSIEDIERLLGLIEKDVETDIDLPTVGNVIVDFMEHAGDVEIYEGTGPYEGGGERKSDGQWVIPEDKKAWEEVIEAFEEGEDPKSVIALPWEQGDSDEDED